MSSEITCRSVIVTNVKCTLEQEQRGSRGIALLFFNFGARWGWLVTPGPV
jgi:hypothetical protein